MRLIRCQKNAEIANVIRFLNNTICMTGGSAYSSTCRMQQIINRGNKFGAFHYDCYYIRRDVKNIVGFVYSQSYESNGGCSGFYRPRTKGAFAFEIYTDLLRAAFSSLSFPAIVVMDDNGGRKNVEERNEDKNDSEYFSGHNFSFRNSGILMAIIKNEVNVTETGGNKSGGKNEVRNYRFHNTRSLAA